MTKRQLITVISPVAVIATMLPVFRLTATRVGPDAGWYIGMTFYWLVWCTVFSLWVLGWDKVRSFFKPQRVTWEVALLVFLPLAMAAGFKIVTGTDYSRRSLWMTVGLIVSAFANGSLEETLWRGVFKETFEDSLWLRIVWPSLMFGLWHYAPVSVHGDPWSMVIGATLFGFYLAFIVKRTGSVWWAIVTHTLAAFVMIA